MVYIIDEIMGRGKTTAMINHINQTEDDQKFLFVTPYLTEVDRIMTACRDKHFCQPAQEGGKLNNMKWLLKERRNVVSTHALFKLFDDEVLDLVKEGEYTLVIDEVMSVVEELKISPYDSDIILKEYVSIDEDGLAYWDNEDYEGKFEEYKSKLESGNTVSINKERWISIVPTEYFTSFKDVYLMTYMFEHQVQRCYFELYDIKYERLYVAGDSPETYKLCEEFAPTPPIDYASLIHIFDNKKLNSIGEGYHDLSKNWYKKNLYSSEMKKMKNNLYNFFRNYAKTSSELNMWTVFREDKSQGISWQKILSGKGYAKGFVPCNARGTNDHRHRTTLAYIVNRFPNTGVRNFLSSKGIHLNQDFYALSEMLQWIWRSAIRDGKEIFIYIPSRRMRRLLTDWIKKVGEGGFVY